MLEATDTPAAPWHVVPADDKRRARLNLIRHLLSSIPYEKVGVDLPEIPEGRAAPQERQRGPAGRAGHAKSVLTPATAI